MPTKIFVGNIAINTTRDSLLKLFQQYGCVTECDILGNYGFVHMMMEEDAVRAIRELHGVVLNGNRLNVELSTATTQGKRKAIARFGSVKIFVGNIRDGTNSDQLRELFECYGKVIEADVLSGFGFVHMENEAEAHKAIRSLNGHVLNGNRLNVEISTSATQGKARERDARGVRGTVGLRYDPYTLSAALPRRPEAFAVDTFVPTAAAAAGTAAFVTDPYQAAAALYQRPTAIGANESFARELLELYSTNPSAFAAYARNPVVRQSLNLSAVESVNVSLLPAEDLYARGLARGDYYDKNVGTRLADLSLAPASALTLPASALSAPMSALSAPAASALAAQGSVDPSYLAAAALRADPGAVSVTRGFSTVRVAAPPAGVTFGAAPAAVATIRGTQFVTPGGAPQLYAPFP